MKTESPDPNYREPASPHVIVEELEPLLPHTPQKGGCIFCGSMHTAYFACPGDKAIVTKGKSPGDQKYTVADPCDDPRPHVHVCCEDCYSRWECEPKYIADLRRRPRERRIWSAIILVASILALVAFSSTFWRFVLSI